MTEHHPKTGIEIDLVLSDSRKAMELYESIFPIQRVELTDYPQGLNEGIFTLYGVRFHLLDHNPDYQLIAPQPGAPQPVWVNIAVPNLLEVYEKALRQGCAVVQPATQIPELGVLNAIVTDPFGHLWMLHQLGCLPDFQQRLRLLEDRLGLPHTQS